jgi:hypothetical protein
MNIQLNMNQLKLKTKINQIGLMGFFFCLRRKDKERIKCEHLIKYDGKKVQILEYLLEIIN